jgi:Phasin protein
MTGDNDAITLKDPAKRFGFSVSTLRTEADRGRLTIYRIGRRYYTTPADIREMVLQCRVELPTAPQDDRKQTSGDNESRKGVVFPSAAANVRAYQAKLLEMAQADMQFGFEFAERLAAIRSPVEFPRVIAEFTGKRITMFVDRSRQVAELSTRRKAT